MSKLKGTEATGGATLPKQMGKRANSEKGAKKTAKVVQKKPVGETVAVKKVDAKVPNKTAGETAPTKDVDVAHDLAKFPGTSYGQALHFSPCTVYFDIPNAAWRITAKPGGRKTELVRFKLDGNNSKPPWRNVVKKVNAYQT